MFLSPTVAPPSRHPHQRHHHHCRGSAAQKPTTTIIIEATPAAIPHHTDAPPRLRAYHKGAFGTALGAFDFGV
ncbi:hypothetical protein Tco_0053278 [Tanacetum coccineum]